MRILYFILFMLSTVGLSAQTPLDFQNGTDQEISEVKLYPNPAFEGVVHILTKANADKRIIIYDVFGKVVLTDKITGKTLDISQLVAGVYALQVNEGQKTMTRKLVVK
ncbi:T9SS type A sorting domain-containing protein [Pricia sp.]|uniref:T9SS type A sorting domain-containing protein n=1 Tax=Pricia sp. TaxID=2268138 RepID=UPI0035943D4D